MIFWRLNDGLEERALGLFTYVSSCLHCGVEGRDRLFRQHRVVRPNWLEEPGHIDDLADLGVVVLNDAVIGSLCGCENKERPHGAQQCKTQTLHLSLLEILLCRVTAQNRMPHGERLARPIAAALVNLSELFIPACRSVRRRASIPAPLSDRHPRATCSRTARPAISIAPVTVCTLRVTVSAVSFAISNASLATMLTLSVTRRPAPVTAPRRADFAVSIRSSRACAARARWCAASALRRRRWSSARLSFTCWTT